MAGKIGTFPVAEKRICLRAVCRMLIPCCIVHDMDPPSPYAAGALPCQVQTKQKALSCQGLAFFCGSAYVFPIQYFWGRTGFDGDVEAEVAGRGAAGLVKSGNKSNCQRKRLRLRLRCLVSVWYRLFFNSQVVTGDAQ